ncbi:MAG: PDZ domain-containing protein [Oscillospiraceae bacterium]|jgi:carboxyl-terminal processing protease|nr:PDZ domain-containing protein [Oscillospiraceae bacterium]
MKTRRLAALFIAFLLLLPVIPQAMAVPESPEEQFELLKEIDDYITFYYLDSTGESYLSEGLTAADLGEDQTAFFEVINGMIGKLDEYSGFLTIEAYDELFPAYAPPSYGIGIEVDVSRPWGAFVNKTLPGSAAGEEGLAQGDQIVSVDGVDIRGLPFEQVTPLLRGEEFSEVSVGVRHPGALQDEIYVLERRYIDYSYVEGYKLSESLAYVEITDFLNIADIFVFIDLLQGFKDAGVQDLIIDLRGNGGGEVNIAYDMLISLGGTGEEALFSLVDNVDEYIFQHYPEDEIWTPRNLVVLMDENSASASEIMGGSLQDRGRAVIVGVPSYGKARSQALISLSSGDFLLVTTFVIELPVSGEYQGVGIIPDHHVEQETALFDLSGFEPLLANRALLPALSSASRVLALEQRLELLGFFLAEPDGVFDAYTLHALNCFQLVEGVTVTNYASVQSLQLLETYVQEISETEYILSDTQLEYALELLEFVPDEETEPETESAA